MAYRSRVATSRIFHGGNVYVVDADRVVTITDDQAVELRKLGVIEKEAFPATADLSADSSLAGTEKVVLADGFYVTLSDAATYVSKQITEELVVCDQATPATAVTAAVLGSRRMPFAGTIVGVRASLHTASDTGAVTIDVTKNGTTIFSTGLTVDQDEKTSVTAATAAVVSVAAFASDDEFKTEVTGAGVNATGLRVALLVKRT